MKINKIQQNIPVPDVRSRVRYPWSRMEIGDSVLILAGENEQVELFKRKIYQSARYYGDKTGKKFKHLFDHEENGVRVWRVA